MRFSRFTRFSPPFSGFCLDSKGNVPASYFNIYHDNIDVDWEVIADIHHLDPSSRIELFNISYNYDGTIKDADYKIISRSENGFKHFWIQLLISRASYLVSFAEVEQCYYYNDLMKVSDFFLLWNRLDLAKMKPAGNFEWFEFSFYGGKESYAVEYTKKYLITERDFIQFGNDELPVTGYFISSYGMAKIEDKNECEAFQGEGYQDYFFGVCES